MKNLSPPGFYWYSENHLDRLSLLSPSCSLPQNTCASHVSPQEATQAKMNKVDGSILSRLYRNHIQVGTEHLQTFILDAMERAWAGNPREQTSNLTISPLQEPRNKRVLNSHWERQTDGGAYSSESRENLGQLTNLTQVACQLPTKLQLCTHQARASKSAPRRGAKKINASWPWNHTRLMQWASGRMGNREDSCPSVLIDGALWCPSLGLWESWPILGARAGEFTPCYWDEEWTNSRTWEAAVPPGDAGQCWAHGLLLLLLSGRFRFWFIPHPHPSIPLLPAWLCPSCRSQAVTLGSPDSCLFLGPQVAVSRAALGPSSLAPQWQLSPCRQTGRLALVKVELES
jgi:hypothetical protein